MPNRCKDIENWQGKHWQSKTGETGATFAEKCSAAADVSNTGRKSPIEQKPAKPERLLPKSAVQRLMYQIPVGNTGWGENYRNRAAFAEKCGAAAEVSNTGRKHRIGRKLPEQSSLFREIRCSVADVSNTGRKHPIEKKPAKTERLLPRNAVQRLRYQIPVGSTG